MFSSSKRFVTALALASLFIGGLASCGEAAAATYIDKTATSIYGKISDFNLQNGKLTAGQKLTFKVTPAADFSIDAVTVNGKAASAEASLGTNYYSWTLAAGINNISASYKVDATKDFVSDFKLNISDELFSKVMTTPSGVDSEKKNFLDFRTNGIEQVMTEYTDPSEWFINYVDGDTTHVTTRNYGYTVKIRYLGIDTPESTSEVEVWGKSASNYNKSQLSTAKHIILEGQGTSLTGNEAPATADSNQRSLAYVWYTDVALNPKKEDFRCLNLDMVYQGFSSGIGSIEDMGENFYLEFDKANKSAQANKRHIYSTEIDPNFCYNKPAALELARLYATSSAMSTDSPFADDRTLYKVHGFVSRKLKTAFFIQDKASYSGDLPDAYGIYVFTYAETPIAVGDEVNVIGLISTYGGSYQMQGISYHTLNADLERDTQIVSRNNEIKPIQVTAAQFASKQYNNVLVTISEDLYCYNKTSSYNGVVSDSAEGGVQEINKYNLHYPFYNTTNKIIGYAKAGSDTGSEIRFVSNEEVLYDYNTQYAWTYKFFTGGTNYYNAVGAEYANLDADNQYKDQTITTVYKRKQLKATCISQLYVSTSGKTKNYTAVFAAKGDINFIGELA